MKIWQRSILVPAAAVLAALLLGPGSPARERAEDPDPAAADAAAGDESAPSHAEQKKAAKEARIAEYLRKKEERLLRREQARHEEDVARDLERRQLAEPAAEPDVATHLPPQPAQGKPRSTLPRGLARAQERVRQTDLDDDATVVQFLEMVDNQAASPHQLAAFGNFLSDNGLHGEALAYYDVALSMIDDDAVLWLNAGTLHRKVHDLSAAASAYSRALSINPNYGLAHYNLGAVLDSRGKYKQALEEYKVALVLDPTLGDPAFNPQAVTNEHLTTVKLMLYQESSGGAGLPLVEVPAEKLPRAASAPR